jgi:predicted aspartyl protease
MNDLRNMNRLHFIIVLRMAPAIIAMTGLTGCADSFAVKREAVPEAVQKQLQLQAIPTSEIKLTEKGVSNLRTHSVPPPEGVLKVPMYYERGVPYLKVSLNGHKAKKYMLDTGAAMSVFDAEQAVEYGMRTLPQIRPTMAGVLEKVPGMAAVIPTLQIGTWRLENLPCIIRMQRTTLGAGILKEHLGISLLGVNMLAKNCKYATLDFLKEEFEFGLTRSFPGQVRKHMHKASLSMTHGVPTTLLKCRKLSWEAVVDSGSVFGVQLDRRIAEVLGYKNGGWDVGGNYLITGVGGAQTPKEANVRVLEFKALGLFGSFYPFAQVDVMPGPSRLGTYLMEDYRVTLDFEHNVLWVEWG